MEEDGKKALLIADNVIRDIYFFLNTTLAGEIEIVDKHDLEILSSCIEYLRLRNLTI